MSKSVGCVDFGNNNFYEVLYKEGEITFIPHESEDEVLTFTDFIKEVPDYHLSGVFQQLSEITEIFKNEYS